MKHPFHPEQEMLTAEEAAKIRADLDAKWTAFEAKWDEADTIEKRLALTDEMNELHIDEMFAPFEVTCPTLAELYRRKAA